jgi:hypothetical protein
VKSNGEGDEDGGVCLSGGGLRGKSRRLRACLFKRCVYLLTKVSMSCFFSNKIMLILLESRPIARVQVLLCQCTYIFMTLINLLNE